MTRAIRHIAPLVLCAALLAGCAAARAENMVATVAPDGHYTIALSGSAAPVLTAGVAAQVDGRWLRSAEYPSHTVRQSEVQGDLGAATEWQVTFSGLAGQPQLHYQLLAFHDAPFAELQASVENRTGRAIHVQAIRVVDAAGPGLIDLGGPSALDRVLSDSFSEDRPAMRLHDLADADHAMHRAVGVQLVDNRQSRESLFIGALTSDRFLTILRLHLGPAAGPNPAISSYEVDSTGTTEMEKENSLQDSPPEDQIDLSLPVPPGGTIDSERILVSVSRDYHHQLETYGALIRKIHHARTTAPPLMGWWSWTAFYFGLNQGAALTNAEWQAQHLEPYGYNVVHIDEGYQYARGEYTTPNATLFPGGMRPLEYKIRGLGLTPGIWTAPFEVSQRAWVYERHPEWLVKNAKGQPIPAGNVDAGKDQLYMLDTTNPGAQAYLRQTYSTMAHEWGIHYFKLDFMDDSAIEGYRYKPNTTAMEAQRIGLAIIRQAVGDNVWLDKDGSVMLNPVGYVDYGRISQDTGHTFDATKEAAPGMAARYYMDRNFFVADPDAFSISTQTIADQSWHESRTPATMNESRSAIALAAVAGGMFEIGDNLPSLQNSPERLGLLENPDLLDMIHLSRASTPVDLMDYDEADEQPSIFILKESPRQSILTVFNWTTHDRRHAIPLVRLGLSPSAHDQITPVLDPTAQAQLNAQTIDIIVPAHGVRMLKIMNQDVPAAAPVVTIQHTENARAGETVALDATATAEEPVVAWHWDFGDGIGADGAAANHTWTEPGDYTVTLQARGIDGLRTIQHFPMRITGHMATTFNPADIRRPQ